MKPVCLVIGAGAGIGGNVGKRFAREGYHAVLCRRSDKDGLDRLVAEIESEGGSASGHILNAVEADSLEQRIDAVEADIGPIEVVVFNLGAQIGNRSLTDTSYKAFEMGWRLATFALFRVASAIAHILIDGSVDAPDTLGKMLGPERFQELRETRGMEHDGLMLPARIADTYWHLAQQHRSVWTHELDLRAYSDLAWWNH